MTGAAVYAQTNIQLFSQLRAENYSAADQYLIRDAYELASELFTGFFTATGRTQIAHVVGTASILCSLHAPAELVAAGLIHNAYQNGDFGDGRRGISKARREQIRHAVGASVEAYVCRFPARKRAASATISDALDAVDRHVILIALADWLEHRLNYETASRNGSLMAERAEQLGFPGLAAEIRNALGAVPNEFDVKLATNGRRRSGTLAPRSYRKKLRVLLRPKLRDGVNRLYSSHRLRRALSQLVHLISRRSWSAAEPSPRVGATKGPRG